MTPRYGASWCWSHSCEFMLLPTVKLEGRHTFQVFDAVLMWGYWGIGFYIYDKEYDMAKKQKVRDALEALAEAKEPTIDEQINAIAESIEAIEAGGEQNQNVHAAWELRCLRAAAETLRRIKRAKPAK